MHRAIKPIWRERVWELCAINHLKIHLSIDTTVETVFGNQQGGGKPHKIITAYDKRADVENLVGEAKREGLDAIRSAKFKTNYAFFHIVMLAYNIWRYLKMISQLSIVDDKCAKSDNGAPTLRGIMNNTIRIARLKLLFIAAKVVKESNRHKVKYSIHDARTPLMLNLLNFLDKARLKLRPWEEDSGLPQRFSLQTM